MVLEAQPIDFNKTAKQMEIMRVIFKAAGEGKFLSPKELHKLIAHGAECKYPALICSISYLRRHGMIESVYGDDHGPHQYGLKSYLKPTPKAYRTLSQPSEI